MNAYRRETTKSVFFKSIKVADIMGFLITSHFNFFLDCKTGY